MYRNGLPHSYFRKVTSRVIDSLSPSLFQLSTVPHILERFAFLILSPPLALQRLFYISKRGTKTSAIFFSTQVFLFRTDDETFEGALYVSLCTRASACVLKNIRTSIFLRALSYGISKPRNKSVRTEQEIEEKNFILFTRRLAVHCHLHRMALYLMTRSKLHSLRRIGLRKINIESTIARGNCCFSRNSILGFTNKRIALFQIVIANILRDNAHDSAE